MIVTEPVALITNGFWTEYNYTDTLALITDGWITEYVLASVPATKVEKKRTGVIIVEDQQKKKKREEEEIMLIAQVIEILWEDSNV